MFIPSRIDLEPRLTVRKLITSQILSPTLLQIYCIGLIGPISNSFLVYATICDPTDKKCDSKQVDIISLKLILNFDNMDNFE